ncbi:MAG: hypothetical protein K6G28_01210 [Acholeplasmatales bacterium]|nr:hypothetical protein [Acholeplasmatales bacterium]
MYNLLLAGNKNVYDGAVINALSYIKYNKKETTVYLLTMDLTDINPKFTPINQAQADKLEAIYKRGNPNSKVILVDCREQFLAKLGNSDSLNTGYTPYTYLRLFIDKSIPVDKILYLDTDTIFNGNIDELYNLDISDYEYAGAHDYMGQFWISRNYINAGVLLFNLKKIRETRLFDVCIEALSRKKYTFNDQDVLNLFVEKKYIISNIYNNQHKYTEETVIQHFSKTIRWIPYFRILNIKPWMVDDVHKIYKLHAYDDILNEYLSMKEE